MKISHFTYLLEVEKCRSINKASINLFMNQQQLSKVIKSIEADFGTAIFERTSRGVSVTENGAEILAKAQEICTIYDELKTKFKPPEKDAKCPLKGKLTIFATENLWDAYSIIMGDFSIKYPQVSLEFILRANEEIIELVRKTPSSLGLIVQIEQDKLPTYTIPNDLSFQVAYEASVVAYAASGSQFQQKYQSLTLKKLFSLPLISLVASAFDNALAQNAFKNIGQPNLKYVVSDKRSFFELLAKGNCLTLGVGKKEQHLLESKDIVSIPIRDKVKYIPGVIFSQSNLNNPLVTSFAEIYLDYYKNY